MDKKVDLQGIKNIAICFLNMKPTPCPEMMGLVVWHPFYNSPYLCLIKEGKPIQFTFDDKEHYQEWIQFMTKRINSFKCVNEIFMLMNSAYLMNFLRLTYQYFHSKEELAAALRFCWSYQECPNWTERGRSLLTCKKLFNITRKYFMEPEEQQHYDSLPDKVVIYRGQSHDGKYYKALSWTDDLEKATWFANRFKQHGEQGHLFKAEIDKKYIYAFNNERGEAELILDYTKLENIEELPL